MNKIFILLLATTSMSFAARIGVLKADRNYKCSEEVILDLDVEDKNNKTRVIEGSSDLPGIILGGHVQFTYCVIDQSSLPKIAYDYIVLRLDNSCPSGSFQFARHHDTEDTNNRNGHLGNISPNFVERGHGATLEYCFVPKDASSSKKYPFNNKAYAVFANPNQSILPKSVVHSSFYVDDENDHVWVTGKCPPRADTPPEKMEREECPVDTDHNGNSWNFNYGINIATPSTADIIDYSSRIARIFKIMYGEDDTIFNVIRWNGGSLAKSADVVDNIAIENTLVAAAPLAPAIKGLNRNAVAVELKSTGDVNVSIVGVNGAIIANITEKILQAGTHQIKWNSGMVPSGHYIVKVEQNGMVNAKNVILK